MGTRGRGGEDVEEEVAVFEADHYLFYFEICGVG